MGTLFKRLSPLEALSADGVRITLDKTSWTRVHYEVPGKKLTITYGHDYICDLTISVYLFSLPSGLCWNNTDSEVTEAEKDVISAHLIDAFSVLGALGLRFDALAPEGAPKALEPKEASL